MISELKKDTQLDFWFKQTEDLTDQMQEKLYRYYELIYEYNKVMNLTGIDDLHGVYLKHFYDSITIRQQIDKLKPKTIADLGTGAGLPGIVLAIIYPDIAITLIEPLAKRCRFLEVVCTELGLTNVEVLNKRAEDLTDNYDLVVSRAVARLNILLEIAYKIIKPQGSFLALKAQQANTELDEAKKAIEVLHLVLTEQETFLMPVDGSVRSNLLFYKEKENKQYPRNFGMIKKKPL